MKAMTQQLAAGVCGTTAMTGGMFILNKTLTQERPPLEPPEQVVRGLSRKVFGISLRPKQHPVLVLSNHFLYGGGAALAYGTLAKNPTQHPMLKGMAFGVGLWAFSYLGWLPAFDIQPLETRKPKNQLVRNVLLHLVYGAVVGAAYARLSKSSAEA